MRTALTDDERRFLQEKRFAVLGTVNPDGSPHLTVMWYLLEGNEVMFNTARGRKKPANLDHDPRVSLVVPDGYRFVRVEGRARAADDRAVAQADIRRLAARYYEDEAQVEKAVAERWSKQHRVTYRFRIRRVYSFGF